MKIISSTVLALALLSLSTVSFARGVPSSYAPSNHKHHTSHGGHHQGGEDRQRRALQKPSRTMHSGPLLRDFAHRWSGHSVER